MGQRPRRLPLASLALGLLLTACASGPSSQSIRRVQRYILTEDYAGAESYLERSKESEYGRKNMVLYHLDRGLVLHHAGKYLESEASFDVAESRIEELYTKSLSQAAGMLLLNDNTVDYAGEPFERALTNVFRALNYLLLGKPDEALVESRKVEAFLDELSERLERKNTYKDDAFARYLDALLYADQGKWDDSRISLTAARKVYSWYSTAYNTPAPPFELPALRPSEGELVFIHYNGVAPRKISKTFQVAWSKASAIARADQEEGRDARFRNALTAGFIGSAVTVSYPEYVQDPFKVASSEVRVGTAAAATLLVEDISAIAIKTLRDRMAVIKARAIARATVKYVIAESIARGMGESCDKKHGRGSLKAQACRALSRGLAHGSAAATEAADTRGWSSLPSQIRLARLRLPPGTHEVQALFKDAGGEVLASKAFKDIKIQGSRRTYLAYRTAL
ncbi:MAG: hypothetical protein HY549_00555 [Elusimicrobia bacterium]|nr:hypothetical protein [Elusimicrobiota bacterium]